ncbi:helix-turn-helix transcriptional regulator [Candidatus Nomurabacteria bacterium]|nr:helix-turn-helix transcriptional regulator [Candidatus Nomurabacteria bacterium]
MKKSIFSQDHKYLINQLKKARVEVGLEQEEVARVLRKTQSYVSKIESGQRRIDIVQLKQFARLYKKPINYFLK